MNNHGCNGGYLPNYESKHNKKGGGCQNVFEIKRHSSVTKPSIGCKMRIRIAII